MFSQITRKRQYVSAAWSIILWYSWTNENVYVHIHNILYTVCIKLYCKVRWIKKRSFHFLFLAPTSPFFSVTQLWYFFYNSKFVSYFTINYSLFALHSFPSWELHGLLLREVHISGESLENEKNMVIGCLMADITLLFYCLPREKQFTSLTNYYPSLSC